MVKRTPQRKCRTQHQSAGSADCAPNQRPAPSAAEVSGLDGSEPGQYQGKLCELEMNLTSLHARNEALKGKVVDVQRIEGHFASLFKTAPVGYLVLDGKGRIRELNDEAMKLVGLHANVVIGLPFSQFVAREDVRVFLRHLRECKLSRHRVSTELLLCPEPNRSLPVELITVPVESAPPSFVTGFRTVLTDLSGRYHPGEPLNHNGRSYEPLVNAIDGIVWEADAHSLEMQFVSRSVQGILGHSPEEYQQPHFWRNHVHVDDRERVLNLIAQAVGRRQDLVVEYRMAATNRQWVWLQDHIVSREDTGGRLKLLGVAVDVTERKRVEDQLCRAKAELEARVEERTKQLQATVGELEAFAYSLSHDMRAPLRAIQGYAHVLASLLGEKVGPKEKDIIQRIIQSTSRMDLLVRDVLSYSRVGRLPLELKAINLEQLIQSVVNENPALQEPNAKVQVRKPLLPVRGHEVFLTQCVSNLLTNAVKFTRSGETPQVRISTRAEKDRVQVCFEDNGIGIAPQDQQRIFNLFQRLHSSDEYEGTGIGLAIVQRAVERMGGQVGVQSTKGKGSKFWLELPKG